MIKLYKLVSQDWTTCNGMEWSLGKTNKASGKGSNMCSLDVLHAYTDPLLAVLLNPIHASILKPIILEVDCSFPVAYDRGLKVGVKEMTPVRILRNPKITTEQRITFAIYCALSVCDEPRFVMWAHNWLNHSDRSYTATRFAADVADVADDYVIGRVAALAPDAAALSAARAACAAADVADCVVLSAARAADAAARAADAAEATSLAALAALRAARAALRATSLIANAAAHASANAAASGSAAIAAIKAAEAIEAIEATAVISHADVMLINCAEAACE